MLWHEQISELSTILSWFVILLLILFAFAATHSHSRRKLRAHLSNIFESLKHLHMRIFSLFSLKHQRALLRKEALHAKNQFLAQISHEVRTPVGAILGFSELMLMDDCTPEKRKEYGEGVRRNGLLLTRIISDILDLAKVDMGQLEIRRELTRLRDLFTESEYYLKLQALEKGLYLDLRISDSCPEYLFTDPIRVRQILNALLSNAVHFTHKGGIKVDVSFSHNGSSKNDMIWIEIEDSGEGINPHNLKKLFQPFESGFTHQSDNSRQITRAGISLALSKKLAMLLGGDLTLVRSNPKQGSIFLFTFSPATKETQAAMRQQATSMFMTSPSGPKFHFHNDSPLTGRRILLAEDSPDNQLLITTFLTRAGASVDIANNGAECIEMAYRKSYDLILMDIQMPVMDGYEALNHLLDSGYTAPIVAITAHALKEDRKRCLDAGFSEHLVKPIDRVQLVETIRSQINF